ncbi:MFS transporter [Limosilactobacillus agrestimuris]|uniref:MFS transporter n=1 Tax=Limosilactobacillus agrestimuris TaxID=2941331 RepID=UPI00203F4475|nr:MFS transporter [Limosilactobacillus agrestimuris]
MPKAKTLKLKWLALASLLNSTGAAFLWPLTTVFINKHLGESLTVAGIVLFIMSITMILGNYLGGYLFDRWNAYFISVWGAIIATVAIILMIFFHNWPAFPVLICFVSFGDGICASAINSYGNFVPSKDTRFVYNMVYLAFNVGVVLGTLLVGILYPISIDLTFIIASCFYIIFLLTILFCFNVPIHKRSKKKSISSHKVRGPQRIRITIVYTIFINLIMIYLAYALWESIMSVHITNLGIPFVAYSLLWTMNGAIIIIGQPIISYFAPYIKLYKQIYAGLLLFTFSFIFLPFIHTLLGFTLDFIMLTIGDMLSVPGIPAWVSEITPINKSGRYQSLISSTISIGRAIGPLLGGIIIEAYSYNTLFITAFFLMLITFIPITITNHIYLKTNRVYTNKSND